jgi:hypothetical protein
MPKAFNVAMQHIALGHGCVRWLYLPAVAVSFLPGLDIKFQSKRGLRILLTGAPQQSYVPAHCCGLDGRR